MPRTRKYNNRRRNYKSRRNYRAKRSYRRNKARVMTTRIQNGFPDALIVKQRFSYRTKLDTTPVHKICFLGNSCVDVWQSTGAGDAPLYNHPMLYTQWTNIYSRYLVNGSSIRVRSVADTDAPPIQLIVWPSDEDLSAQTITAQNAASQTYAKNKICGVTDGTSVMPLIKHYMSSKRMFGVKSLDLTDHAPVNTATPTQKWHWNIQLNSLDGTSALDNFVIIDLVYYVRWFERYQYDEA